MNGGAKPGDMFVPQTGEWRINRANLKLDAAPLQRQHLSIAKRLRNDRIPGVKITEPHSLQLRIADCGLWMQSSESESGITLFQSEIRALQSAIHENWTSLPGSISKSSARESSVFGLMISSVNFTKIGSSRKMAYLSIDSKSMAMKNGQSNLGSIRFA